MPPCLALSIIRYGSRVKWSNPGKGVAPSPTPWCRKLSKREPSGHPRLWSTTYNYNNTSYEMTNLYDFRFKWTATAGIRIHPNCQGWLISKIQWGHLEERHAIKLRFKLGKNAKETYGMLQTAFRPSCINRASVFEWHKRFKEGRESVRDDERCGRSKKVNTPELIGQRVRLKVRVTMLRF